MWSPILSIALLFCLCAAPLSLFAQSAAPPLAAAGNPETPAGDADDPQESESDISVSVVDPQEHMLRLIREQRPGSARSVLVREFLERFPESPHRDAACAADLEGSPDPKDLAEAAPVAEQLLTRNCLRIRACNLALTRLTEAPTAETRLEWAGRCHRVSTEERQRAASEPDPTAQAATANAANALALLAEYQVFTLAWNARGTAAQRFLDDLRAMNPRSDYLTALYDRSLQEALAANDMALVRATANRSLQANPENVSSLIALANALLATRQDLDQVVPLTSRALAILDRPTATVTTADTAAGLALRRQRGQALWIQGTYFAAQRRWKEADVTLRRSLPYLADAQTMLASALYHLGLANSQLDRKSESLSEIRDAIRFLEQCAAISSQYKAEAANLLITLRPHAQR